MTGELEVDGVRIGGLMRCCLETLGDHYPDGPELKAAEGEVLHCKYCRESMIFRYGYWYWNRGDWDLAA